MQFAQKIYYSKANKAIDEISTRHNFTQMRENKLIYDLGINDLKIYSNYKRLDNSPSMYIMTEY